MRTKIFLFTTFLLISSVCSAQMSKEREEKAVELMREASRCAAFGNIHIRNGGGLTEGNRKYYANAAKMDEHIQGSLKQVQECRAQDPSSASLHQKCAESLPKYNKILYESFVKGSQMMSEAYATNNKAKIGTYMLSCSQ